MAKKIEVDIDYLKSIGLSQKQISGIIKNCEPDHWTTKLPQDNNSFELYPFTLCPEEKMQGNIQLIHLEEHPTYSFFTKQDAEFIENKCRLLIEMSNFSYAVNESWCPDWNNKEDKKYGIVLQNGQARVSENELFNLYVFGIVTKSRSLALEMLEEFKNRIETYFNKPFNSVSERITIAEQMIGGFGVPNLTRGDNTAGATSVTTDGSPTIKETYMALLESINPKDVNPNFIGSFAQIEETTSGRKKRKHLLKSDVAKIQELLLEGVQQKDVAKQFGYSQSLISKIKRKMLEPMVTKDVETSGFN
jgi:hypothetical protein